MAKNIKHIIEVIDYIEEHLYNELDLETVANAVHYSKYHLHHIFTNTAGLTIHSYIQRRKLTEAAKLLVFSDMPILEIALMAGYRSQQAFTDIFKVMYKKSPNQYRKEKEFYPLQLKYILNENVTDMEGIEWKEQITFATNKDIPAWMDLVCLVIDGFPYLEEGQYRRQLQEYIHNRQALILKDNNITIGNMLFHKGTGRIDFFGIHPQYRKKGIIKDFCQKVLYEFSDSGTISITTFRKGDRADTGYRKIWEGLGFTEGELLTEFGYPTQRFLLRKEDIMGCRYE